MDREVLGENPPETYLGCVMTTWHAEDSLEDGLEFFLTCAYPDEKYSPHGCDSALIVSVGSNTWPNAIKQYVTARTMPVAN